MKEVLISLRRTPYLTLSIFLSLFFALLVSGVFLISLIFLYSLLHYIEGRPQVTVYFETTFDESKILKIKEELVNSGQVSKVNYISQQQAYERWKNLNKNNPLLVEMITPENLPASLEIFAKRPEFLPQISEFFKKKPGVDEVQFEKIIVERLLRLTSVLRIFSLGVFGFIIFMMIIVLTTIISFKVVLRKEEIELLRLMGANKWFIRKPFILESVLLSLLSSVSSSSLIFGVIVYYYPFLDNYLGNIERLFLPLARYEFQVWPISLGLVIFIFIFSFILGFLISIISTLLATSKYIKV